MVLITNTGFNLFLFFMLFLSIVYTILFSRLTLVVRKRFLQITFSNIMIVKKIMLKDIKSISIVKKDYYGFGIVMTLNGWLYRVAGSYAIEVIMESGKKYQIGTDEPEALEKAILERLKIC
jgi:hypothetical protein